MYTKSRWSKMPSLSFIRRRWKLFKDKKSKLPNITQKKTIRKMDRKKCKRGEPILNLRRAGYDSSMKRTVLGTRPHGPLTEDTSLLVPFLYFFLRMNRQNILAVTDKTIILVHIHVDFHILINC